ncbi:MAG: hypothetical protein JNK04_13255, partial [Myxococcales bacterium]|nr:hypothetical protein [Myxococcales bacterium]
MDTSSDAQPVPAPPPPSATVAVPPPPEGAQPAPSAVQAVPVAPEAQPAPPAEPEPFAPYASAPRDKRGNLFEGRPPRLQWKPGEVIPPGYEPVSGPSKRFLISGMIVGGAPYLGSFIAAYVSAIKGDGEEWGALFAPVVGPFIAIETGEAEDVGAYMLILDGLAQATGIGLTIV